MSTVEGTLVEGTHTDRVDGAELFKAIDHGEKDQPEIPAEVDVPGAPVPPPASAPLSATLVVVAEIAVNHLTPDNPLSPAERDQLRAALDGIEAYYGPIAGGPMVLWGHLAVIVFWIGFPRYLQIRRAREAAAAAAATAATAQEPGA